MTSITCEIISKLSFCTKEMRNVHFEVKNGYFYDSKFQCLQCYRHAFDHFPSFLIIFFFFALANGNDNDSDRDIWRTCATITFIVMKKAWKWIRKELHDRIETNIKRAMAKLQICLTHLCRPLSYQEIIASKHCSFWSVRQIEKKKGNMHSMFSKWFALFLLFNRQNQLGSHHKTKGNGK